MAKVKTWFSRRARFFIVQDTMHEDGFDAYPVEVDEEVITRVIGLKQLLDRMYDSFERNPAPEECAQDEANLLTELLNELFAAPEPEVVRHVIGEMAYDEPAMTTTAPATAEVPEVEIIEEVYDGEE